MGASDIEGRRFQILAGAASSFLLTEQPSSILGDLFSRLGMELGLEVFFNYILDPDGSRMRLQSYSGVSPEKATENEWLAMGEAVCGTVASTRERRLEEGVQEHDHDLCALVRSLGIRAYACFPLMGRERLIGTLSFGTRQRDRFEETEVELLQAVSNLVATRLECDQIMDELRIRTRRLERMVEERDEHIGIISHELRNPLAVVKGAAQLLLQRQNLEADEVAHLLLDIRTHSDRALEVAEKLLTISRARAGNEILLEPVHLRRIVEGLAAEFRSRAPSRAIRVLGDDRPIAWGVGTYLVEILHNLVSNADKYTAPGSPIDIRVWSSGDECITSVRDYGPGVSPRQLGQIFHRFYRSPASSDSADGSGLGLTVCRRLVEVQGGKIEARLPAGGGLEVVFTLPRYDLISEAEPNAPSADASE